jgi:hypothetical protein
MNAGNSWLGRDDFVCVGTGPQEQEVESHDVGADRGN